MQNMQLPLHFHFKIFTPSNDFSAVDARGREVAYTRQKIFKLKEAVEIFSDATRRTRLYRIQADRIIDFNACYRIVNENGEELGSIRRNGMRSLWRISYQIYDAGNRLLYEVREKTRGWHFGMRWWARFRLWACLAVIFSIQVLE